MRWPQHLPTWFFLLLMVLGVGAGVGIDILLGEQWFAYFGLLVGLAPWGWDKLQARRAEANSPATRADLAKLVEAVADAPDPSRPGGYGGEVRCLAEGGDAAGLGAAAVGPAGRRPGALLRPLQLTHSPSRPSAQPEVWVSFAWARDPAAPLMDALCAGLREAGYVVHRDCDELWPGERISDFMRRLSAGRCVVVVLSAAYLRSPYCMTELAGLWREARQDQDRFLRRIVPLVQEDAAIGDIRQRLAHARHWK